MQVLFISSKLLTHCLSRIRPAPPLLQFPISIFHPFPHKTAAFAPSSKFPNNSSDPGTLNANFLSATGGRPALETTPPRPWHAPTRHRPQSMQSLGRVRRLFQTASFATGALCPRKPDPSTLDLVTRPSTLVTHWERRRPGRQPIKNQNSKFKNPLTQSE